MDKQYTINIDGLLTVNDNYSRQVMRWLKCGFDMGNNIGGRYLLDFFSPQLIMECAYLIEAGEKENLQTHADIVIESFLSILDNIDLSELCDDAIDVLTNRTISREKLHSQDFSSQLESTLSHWLEEEHFDLLYSYCILIDWYITPRVLNVLNEGEHVSEAFVDKDNGTLLLTIPARRTSLFL